MMPRLLLCLFLLLLLGAAASSSADAPPVATAWERVTIAPMKTSIYVGSVTLTTTVFQRSGATLTSTYDAEIFPWFFWGETGSITITLTDADIGRMAQGQTAEFTGTAVNHKKKPRTVTGRAQPVDAVSGKIKVRIGVDGTELIFNGTYRFTDAAK